MDFAAAMPTRTSLATPARWASWIAQIAVAAILGQTLFFKLTYAPETQVIFERLGGRPAATLTALIELAAVVLLLIPRTAVVGALVALGTIGGAILTHLTILGIEIVDPATGVGDGGLLFALALAVAVLSGVILVIRRAELTDHVRRIAGRRGSA